METAEPKHGNESEIIQPTIAVSQIVEALVLMHYIYNNNNNI